MNKRFSYDNMIKSRSIEAGDIIRTFKLDRCCDFMEAKYDNPKLTQKEICNQLGFSDRAIRRYRDDIKMDSPYRSSNNKKKKPIQLPDTKIENISKNENSKSVINESSKNKIIEKRIKNRLENDIKGGSISDNHKISSKEIIDYAFQNDRTINQKDRHLSGKELIEQAFKDTINDWFYWNYTERYKNTKWYIKYCW